VALSTIEAKCIVAIDACNEMLRMRMFLEELGMKQENYILNCDSQSEIHIAKNIFFHSKTKHIDVIYHWIH
jgi:hypothetical protein